MGAVYNPKDVSKRYRKKIPDKLTEDIIPGASEENDESTIDETESEKNR